MQYNFYTIATSLFYNPGHPKLLLNLTLGMPPRQLAGKAKSLPMFMVQISPKKLLLKHD